MTSYWIIILLNLENGSPCAAFPPNDKRKALQFTSEEAAERYRMKHFPQGAYVVRI